MVTHIPLGLPPIAFIALVSAVLAIASTLVYKYMTDQALIKTIRADMKKYQAQMKEHKGNPEKVIEIQKQMMPLNSKLMMQTMKPMFITIIPFLLIFHWLRTIFDGAILIPLSFWEGHLGWVGTYIIISMILTTVIRKAMKVA